jgi:hypothetical protein
MRGDQNEKVQVARGTKTRTKENILLLDVMTVGINAQNRVDV